MVEIQNFDERIQIKIPQPQFSRNCKTSKTLKLPMQCTNIKVDFS